MNGSSSLTAIAALIDQRRPDQRSDTVARRIAEWAHLRLTVLDVPDPARPFAGTTSGDGTVHIRVPGDDIGPAVTAHLRSRDGILLVVDAHGGGASGDVLFDDDVEHILQHLRRPVLVLGPAAGDLPGPPRLLVPVDRSGYAASSLDVVESLITRIPVREVVVLALDVPDSWPDGGPPPLPDDADAVVAPLQPIGHHVTLDRTDGSDPVDAVLAASDRTTVVVVASSPWPGGPGHWFSTARDVIRRAPCPVLVVPVSEPD